MQDTKGRVAGLVHIGVVVSDIERSITFYETILGFECYEKVDIEQTSGVIKLAFIRNGSCIIELIQKPNVTQKPDGPVEHIAMVVDDIDAAMTDLKAKGVTFEKDEPVLLPMLFNGVKYAFFRGPDGEQLEINELL